MEPDRFELHFGRTDKLHSVHLPLKDGSRMQLETVERCVDVCEEEDRILLRIIDYKSGMETFDINDLYHGLQMQLVIYMNVASEIYEAETGKEAVPAGMFYYNLKDPILKEEGGEEEMYRKNFRMSGYANSDADILNKLEEGQENFLSASVRLTKKGSPVQDGCRHEHRRFPYESVAICAGRSRRWERLSTMAGFRSVLIRMRKERPAITARIIRYADLTPAWKNMRTGILKSSRQKKYWKRSGGKSK